MEKISNIANSDNSARMQLILSKLFEYKTKLKNESDNKKTIDSTKVLSVGQKLRVILPGEGVFSSEILGNGKDLVISVPKQKNISNPFTSMSISVRIARLAHLFIRFFIF